MSADMTPEQLTAFNQDVHSALSEGVMLVDLRGVQEIETANNAVKGAVNVVWDVTNSCMDMTAFPDDKDAKILLFCRTGRRGGWAKDALEAAGYTQVMNVFTPEAIRAACPEMDL